MSRRPRPRSLSLTLLALSTAVLAAAVSPLLAAPITIVNPSFEADALADGVSASSITGWSTTSGGGDGVLDPVAAEYPTGVADGENVAYVNLPGNFVRQTLSATLEAGRIYTLRVDVGRRVGSSFAGYQVQLRAGGVLLAEDDSSLTPAAGEFVTSTVTHRPQAGDPQLGESLEIHLLSPGVQANFDNVHLDVSRPCLERPRGMVAWWPLDEPAPALSADIVGAHDGDHVGGPVPGAGRVDGALTFDGVNDRVEVDDDPSLDVGIGDFSVDAWIRTTDTSGVATILDKRTNDPGGVLGYSLFLFDGNLSFQLADGGGSATCSFDPVTSSCTNYVSTSFVADGAWHHVAVTVDRADPSGLLFYVDGQQVASFDPTLRPDTLDNDGPLRLGSLSFSVSLLYGGDLDEVELFRRVLEPQEVADLHAVGASGKCKERLSMDWDVPICRDADVSRPTSIEICNDAPVDRDYELTFVPVPAGACSIDGPDTFFLLDPVETVPPAVAVSVSARDCLELPFEIVRPAQMNSNRLVGCFDAVLTDTVTGEEIRHRGSVQDWRECCTAGPSTGVTDVPPGGSAGVVFPVINTNGAPLAFDYRIEAMPPGAGSAESLLSLDGQPAGTPATGSVSFDDGETVDLSVSVAFAGETGLLTEDLILLVDTGGGVYQALASTRVRARLANEVFADGFESGSVSAWSSSSE